MTLCCHSAQLLADCGTAKESTAIASIEVLTPFAHHVLSPLVESTDRSLARAKPSRYIKCKYMYFAFHPGK